MTGNGGKWREREAIGILMLSTTVARSQHSYDLRLLRLRLKLFITRVGADNALLDLPSTIMLQQAEPGRQCKRPPLLWPR